MTDPRKLYDSVEGDAHAKFTMCLTALMYAVSQMAPEHRSMAIQYAKMIATDFETSGFDVQVANDRVGARLDALKNGPQKTDQIH